MNYSITYSHYANYIEIHFNAKIFAIYLAKQFVEEPMFFGQDDLVYIQVFLDKENQVIVRGMDRTNDVSDWCDKNTGLSGQMTTTF